MAAGRNLPSNKLSWNDKAADMIVRAAALSCPRASCPGAFSPSCRSTEVDLKEGKQTQPVSFVEKAGHAGPSAYAAAYGLVRCEMQGHHVAMQQNKGACAARPPPLPHITYPF
jgi:hypothetical protein